MQVTASERASEQASERTSEPQARARAALDAHFRKYFLGVDAGDVLQGIAGSIDYRLSNYPSARITHRRCLRARARLTVLLNDTRIKNFEVEL